MLIEMFKLCKLKPSVVEG